MFKKFFGSIMSLILVFTPLVTFGQAVEAVEGPTVYTSADSLYQFTNPVGSGWEVELSETELYVSFGSDSLIDTGVFMFSGKITDEDTIETLYSINYILTGILNCHEKSPINRYGLDGYNLKCFEDGLNINVMTFFTGDSIVFIMSNSGVDEKDQVVLDEILDNIKIFNSENVNGKSSFITSSNPSITASNLKNWKMYTDEAATFSTEIIVGGILNNDVLDHVSILESETIVPTTVSAREYLEELDYFSFSELEGYSELVFEKDFSIINSVNNTIKTVECNIADNVLALDSTLYSCTAFYIIRNFEQGLADTIILYSFLSENHSQALQKVNNFEEDFLSKLSFTYTPVEIGYDYLGIEEYLYQGADLITAESTKAVYLLKDGKRWVFPTQSTYFSWHTDFDFVQEVSDQELAQYPLGGIISMSPGTLIKIRTVPKVFVVTSDNNIRWIETEATAKRLFGDDWASQVKDVPDTFFANYNEGMSVR